MPSGSLKSAALGTAVSSVGCRRRQGLTGAGASRRPLVCAGPDPRPLGSAPAATTPAAGQWNHGASLSTDTVNNTSGPGGVEAGPIQATPGGADTLRNTEAECAVGGAVRARPVGHHAGHQRLDRVRPQDVAAGHPRQPGACGDAGACAGVIAPRRTRRRSGRGLGGDRGGDRGGAVRVRRRARGHPHEHRGAAGGARGRGRASGCIPARSRNDQVATDFRLWVRDAHRWAGCAGGWT